MSPLSSAGQCADLDKLLEVTRCCRSRCGRDGDIVFRTQPAFKTRDTLSKNAGDDLLLAFIKSAPKPIVEPCLLDEEGNAINRRLLGLQVCL